MSKARELAELGAVYDSGALSNRNIIINGAMNVAQRGTSSTSGLYQTVDRWKLNYGGGGTLTQSQHTLSTSDTPYTYGFRKSFHATVTSASSATGTFSQMEQLIEAQNIATSGWEYTNSNSNLTLSFWVKSSLAGTYYTQFRTSDGTSYYYTKSFTLVADTWKQITCTVAGNSNLQIDNDNGTGFTVLVVPDYGTDYTGHAEAVTGAWYNRTQTSGYFPNFAQDWANTGSATFEITGVQLEVGSEATPFEHRSFGDELAKCQRYYFSLGGDAIYERGAVGYNFSTTVSRCSTHFPTTMRAAPSTSISGALYVARVGSEVSVASASNDNSSTHVGHMGYTVSSGLTAGDGATIFWDNNTTARIMFDAEL